MSMFQQYAKEDITVIISELLVATADSSDPLIDGSVNEVLRTMLVRMNMDVVFVSEFVEGKRVFRFVDTRGRAPELRAGESNPLEETFCQRIVDGRLPGLIRDVGELPAGVAPPAPFRIGTHLSTPIVLKTGQTYGTLCCFSAAPNPALREADLNTLRLCASLVARKLELAQSQGVQEPPPDWQLEPTERYESKVWMEPSRAARRGAS